MYRIKLQFMNKNKTLSICALSLLGGAASVQAETTRPNILFVIMDDASYHHFSANGCSWVDTPNFDNIARNGLRFANCYTPNAKSAPSRACVLTGRNSWQLEEAGNHQPKFPAKYKVVTEALADADYRVGMTGKGWAPGDPGMKDGKKRELTGTPYQKHKLTPPAKFISSCDYVANLSDFLEDGAEDESWFFWFGVHEPHRRYEYGAGIKKGGKRLEDIDAVPKFWPDNEIVRTDMLDYAFEIEFFDKQLGQMIDLLREKDELENTLILITSDNGMPFPRVKANNYEYANHMPFVMMWEKGITKPGRTISDYVSFIDFTPTFLDVAGVSEQSSGMQPIEGESLVPIMTSNKEYRVVANRDYVILGRERCDYGREGNQGYPIRSIIKDSILYLVNLKPHLYPAGNPETGYLDIDGSPTKTYLLEGHREHNENFYYGLSMSKRPAEEMYDLKSDPYCMENLADKSEYKKVKNKLKNQLFKILKKQNDPRMGKNGDVFDNYSFDTENKWNFYERVVSEEIKEPWKQTNWVDPTDYKQYK